MANPKPKYLELTPEEAARVAERKSQAEDSKVSIEWRLLAEFGCYYGWQGIEAVRSNEIDIGEFNNLLTGARKVWAGKLIDLSTTIYTSVGATKSKKPQSVINKGMAEFMKEVRA